MGEWERIKSAKAKLAVTLEKWHSAREYCARFVQDGNPALRSHTFDHKAEPVYPLSDFKLGVRYAGPVPTPEQP